MRRLAALGVLLGVLLGLLLAAGCGSKGSTSTAAYCSEIRQSTAAINATSSTNLKAAYQEFDTDAAKFVSSAPSAVKGDATTVVATVHQIEAALKNVNFDLTKLPPATVALLQAPSFTAALARFDAYNTKVCGLTPATT